MTSKTEIPLVSIIIPTHNSATYVLGTICSTLQQVYPNKEIIVIDDGSTDDTRSILDQYIKTRLIKYIFQINKGLSGARNTGIRKASGKYVALLDSDDIMLPDKIKRQAEFLEQNKNIDIVYTGLIHFIDGTGQKMRLKYDYYSGEVFKRLLYKNFINPNTVMLRKSVFDRLGYFDENLRSAEDWDYWLRLASKEVLFGYIPEALTMYRVRKNSLSSDDITMKETALRVISKYEGFPDKEIRKIVWRQKNKWKTKLFLSYMSSGQEEKAAAVLGTKRMRIILKMVPSFMIKKVLKIMKIAKSKIFFEKI